MFLVNVLAEENGNVAAAARRVGINTSTAQMHIKRIEAYGVMQANCPEVGLDLDVPSPLALKKLSIHQTVDENGEATTDRRWVQFEPKLVDQMEALRDFADGLADSVVPAKPVKRLSDQLVEDMLTVYPLADVHLGMLAWAPETGEDFDLPICEARVNMGLDLLFEQTKPTRTAIIANLGDFFHFDDDAKRTKRAKNELDGDGRWSKVVRLGVDMLKRAIHRALEKHENVIVLNSIGNHDGQTALMLPMILEPHFKDEPRVYVETAPRWHHYYLFGSNLLGFHHGHSTKPAMLPGVMTSDILLNPNFDQVLVNPPIYDADAPDILISRDDIEFCHWYTGHIHHESKEYEAGILVESFRTLASNDAHASMTGYRSLRDIQAVMIHAENGECHRDRVSHKLIQTMLAAA